MAIDDNTSYELTGAQVKDLASKIKAKADSSSLATVATTGSYTDLINTPTIPTVNDATLTITQNGTSAGTFTANASSNATIALTDTTYSAMTGATSSTAGTSGLVPAPAAGDEAKVLSGAGTWVNQSGGGASTVIYYANSTSTAGFQSGTINGPYIYKDAARTTIATPGEIYDNFQAGNSIHIEYESTQTGTSAFAMTLEVATMSLNGSDTYSMVVNEVNEENPGDSRDLVMLRLYTNWDGQSTFTGRWMQQRKYVNTVYDGTLTIKHNGTTKGAFTANQSTASTVNIETIYADDQIVTTPIDWSNILSHFYPVGSIYMSATLATAADVEAALGGTWVAWGAGRVPVGVDTSDADFDTAEETGGEKTHTLTTTEMPSHNHKDLNWTDDSYHTSLDSGSSNGVKLSYSGNSIVYAEGNFRTGYTGGGQSHNNVQPYITCYMYKRTA